jgi:hypothetical protein
MIQSLPRSPTSAHCIRDQPSTHGPFRGEEELHIQTITRCQKEASSTSLFHYQTSPSILGFDTQWILSFAVALFPLRSSLPWPQVTGVFETPQQRMYLWEPNVNPAWLRLPWQQRVLLWLHELMGHTQSISVSTINYCIHLKKSYDFSKYICLFA